MILWFLLSIVADLKVAMATLITGKINFVLSHCHLGLPPRFETR